MRVGGILLCGGKSTRMGVPKAMLPFGQELMLQRVVRLLGEAVRPIVVVAANGQALPDLPSSVIIARDRHPDRGPLEGMLAGMESLQADAAYVTGCDVPLLAPQFVRRMIELLQNNDIVVPLQGDLFHPLAAVYRVCLTEKIAALLSAEQMRPVYLFEQCQTREVPVETLRSADPQLHSLTNCNRPEDYAAALAAAGLPLPADVAKQVKH